MAGDAAAQIRPAYTKNVDEPGVYPGRLEVNSSPTLVGAGSHRLLQLRGRVGVRNVRSPPGSCRKRWIVQMATADWLMARPITNIELRNNRGGIIFDGMKWTFGGRFSGNVLQLGNLQRAPLGGIWPWRDTDRACNRRPEPVRVLGDRLYRYLIDAN